MVELEVALERSCYGFRAANTLLALLASAVQVGRPDVEQAILGTQPVTPNAAHGQRRTAWWKSPECHAWQEPR